MNIIIYQYAEGVGGVEVIFAGFAKYCLQRGHKVYFVTRDTGNNVYYNLLKEMRNEIIWVYRKYSCDIRFMDDAQRRRERESILRDLNLDKDVETLAIVFYYNEFLAIKNLFDECDFVKLYYLWSHPLNFIRSLKFMTTGYDFVKHSNYRQFSYQKTLLQEMVDKGACSPHPLMIDLYNRYYDLNLSKQEYFALPVQFDAGADFKYHYDVNSRTLRVLWVGRFAYFKNDAIEYIAKSLELVNHSNPEYSFFYDIVGYGAAKYDTDIRNRLSKYRKVKINFLGGVHPSKLNELFSHYDLGVAMGTTTKQMGYSGLPTVVIDSLDEEYNDGSICNWVFDSFLGDSGDGMYYHKIGKPLPCRVTLQSILEEIVANPGILNINSKKCKEYVAENYDYEKQNAKILEAARKSRYYASKTPVFMYAWYVRLLRNIWHATLPLRKLVAGLK